MDYQKEYIQKNPTLHIEDAELKFQDVLPVIVDLKGINSIVDVGCGSGQLLTLLCKYFNPDSGVGVDISQDAIEFCRKKHDVESLEWRQIDLFSMALIEKFDLIVCTDVVEHLDDDIAALRLLRGLGSRILLRLPVENCFMNRWLRKYTTFDPWEDTRIRFGHLHHYSISDIKALIRQASLHISRLRLVPLQPRSKRWLELIRLIGAPLGVISRVIQINIFGGFVVLLLEEQE